MSAAFEEHLELPFGTTDRPQLYFFQPMCLAFIIAGSKRGGEAEKIAFSSSGRQVLVFY